MPVLHRPAALAVAALALAGTLLPTVPAAAATTVRCGELLTRDTRLTRDLRCAGDGLTLAPGVRLDLDGHRLRGDGTGTGIRALGSTGASVRDGRIEGWRRGIDFEGATPYPDQTLVLDRVSVTDAPVSLVAAVTQVTRSEFVRSEVYLQQNSFTADRTTFDRSSTVGELNLVTLRRSTVLGAGVAVDEDNEVDIVDSTLDGTGATREAVGCYGRRTLIRTTVRHYATPVFVYEACPTLVSGSTFADNPGGALRAAEGAGGPTTLVVTGSTFRRNAFGVKGEAVSVTDSRFDRNGEGVRLTNGDGSVVASTTITRSTGSGLLVEAGRTSIGGVRSDRNGAYGIHAPQAVDLGGNRASGNGTANCVGVRCAP